MKNLECQICINDFDECRRRPRILSCGHTFCSICLKSVLKDKKIVCPNCKKFHEVENIESININFILESFLSPDNITNAATFDLGFKCKEHFYEQNFFCQTHQEWICRDCTVIKHKPCSHSDNCDNENDCKVFTKTEKLDKIKSDKTEKLQRISESYGNVLKWHINQYESQVNSKLRLREDLQRRLTKFAKENDFEINVLSKKLDSSNDAISSIQKHKEQAKLAHNEMLKAHGRVAVEECCKNLDKIITSAVEWAEKEKCNIKEDKKCIAAAVVAINLKEVESLKQKLWQSEILLSDSKDDVKDLTGKIAEHESTNKHLHLKLKHLQLQLKESKESNLELQKELKAIKQSSVVKKDGINTFLQEILFPDSKDEVKNLTGKIAEHESTNKHLQLKLKESKEKNVELQNEIKKIKQSLVDDKVEINAFKERISELIKDLNHSNRENDDYKDALNYCCKVSDKMLRTFDRLEKYYETSTNTWKARCQMPIVETRNMYEIKNHLSGWYKDAYLIKTLVNEKGDYENYYGQLHVIAPENKDIVLMEAFQKSFSHGSLFLQCPSFLPSLWLSAEYIYLDIGKIEDFGWLPKLVGSPFGRLYIELTTSPRRKEQMLDICSSLNSNGLKYCNFSAIRNRDRPGELVICKEYQKIVYDSQNQQGFAGKCDVLYTNLEYFDQKHPIDAGDVYAYSNGAGFSIATRANYSRSTIWPILGRVVSGLHYLQDALRNRDVKTIGIHSHGIGFPADP